MLDKPWLLVGLFALGFLLPRIPVVGKFFNIINTALHEFGHALMALLTGGSVRTIELFKDTSGTTTTQSSNRFTASLVSLAGYPFAASMSWLSFYLIENEVFAGLIIALGTLFLLMLILWIRNWYGALWVLLFCAINGYLLYLGNSTYLGWAALFYAIMILTESISSTLVLLFLSLRCPKQAGDATNLAKNTGIPAFIWGLLFLAYTAWVSYRVFLMLKPTLALILP